MVIGLLVVGTARADGAWVLWERDERMAPPRWEIIAAYPSYIACFRDADVACNERVEAYSNSGLKTNKCIMIRGGYYHMIDKNLGTEWKCLPESVDPRK